MSGKAQAMTARQHIKTPTRNARQVLAKRLKAKKLPAPPVPDLEQRRMVDEYGELDRRMQMAKADIARYETLKRVIKSWFDQAPADATGAVEGEVYILHLSARERERRVRDIHELVEAVGLEKVLALVSVPLGAIEDIIGKTRLETLTAEARTGSRRIKAVPKYAVTK
jgi:hypothetical protein